MLTKPVGIPKAKQLDLTIPNSPAIQKSNPRAAQMPEPEHLFKANPVKKTEPFIPKIIHQVKQSKDVKLPGDAIREKKMKEFETRLQSEHDEEARGRVFKARPIPTHVAEVCDCS
jgi:hypothetical protein